MTKQNFGLVGNAKEQLVKRFLARRDNQPESTGMLRSAQNFAQIPEKFCRFDKFPGYEKVAIPQAAARKLGIENPYFKTHDGVADATTMIGGKPYINFSSYNYLGCPVMLGSIKPPRTPSTATAHQPRPAAWWPASGRSSANSRKRLPVSTKLTTVSSSSAAMPPT